MDFSLTESQQEVARLAGQLLDGGKADPWKELARAGLLGLSMPPDLGGDDLGVLGTAVLLTEVGRRAAPVPALATLMTGVLPVARWGDDGLRRALLPPAAAGELILTAAIREPSDPMPLVPAVTVTAGPGAGSTVRVGGPDRVAVFAIGPGRADIRGYGGSSPREMTVSGTKVGVPYCAEAGRVLLTVTFGEEGGTGVVIIDPAAAGARLTRTPSAGGGPEYTLRLDRVPVEHVLGGAGCLADLHQLATAGACCLADGALSAALALTRDYVASRHQFGRPLAAFQAVAQQVADVYIASRTLHLATLSACWRLAAGLDAAGDLAVAGYWCTEVAPPSVRTCHHLHGGTGMDVTYPVHHFSALISDLVRFLGGAEYQLERQACSST